MKRPHKLAQLSLLALAAVGVFFWMRSLASWRPVKLGQVNAPYSVSFISSDDRTVLLMTDDMRDSTVLNLSNGSETDWPESSFRSVAFSQKFPEWAFVFEDKALQGELRTREIQGGQLKRTFRWPRPSKKTEPEVLLSHDEKTVSVVDSSIVFQWDRESNKLLRQIHLEKPFAPSSDAPFQFALSLDGSRLLGCTMNQGKIWQLPSGRLFRSWTTKAMGYPTFVTLDARVVAYAYPSTTEVQPYDFVDAATGKKMWSTEDSALKNTDNIGPSSFCNDEVFVPRAANCEVLDSLTGRVKRKLTYPRQSDGQVLRVTPYHIYTQNANGEIFRWRAR